MMKEVFTNEMLHRQMIRSFLKYSIGRTNESRGVNFGGLGSPPPDFGQVVVGRFTSGSRTSETGAKFLPKFLNF